VRLAPFTRAALHLLPTPPHPIFRSLRSSRYLHGTVFYDSVKKEAVHGIIHRDLKPDNCLVSQNYTLKVADFGEARTCSEEETENMTQVGTPIFIAPEVVKGDMYNTACDVYVSRAKRAQNRRR
jgi:serine/threonine protein kinase